MLMKLDLGKIWSFLADEFLGQYFFPSSFLFLELTVAFRGCFVAERFRSGKSSRLLRSVGVHGNT